MKNTGLRKTRDIDLKKIEIGNYIFYIDGYASPNSVLIFLKFTDYSKILTEAVFCKILKNFSDNSQKKSMELIDKEFYGVSFDEIKAREMSDNDYVNKNNEIYSNSVYIKFSLTELRNVKEKIILLISNIINTREITRLKMLENKNIIDFVIKEIIKSFQDKQ